MAEKAPAVYVSITPDLIEYRYLVIEACLAMGMQTLMAGSFAMEDIPSPVLDEADIYLGIIGREYGYVLESYGLSLVEMEYNQATTRGIPCFIFMIEEAA